MTQRERRRVAALVRATEYLFLENLALKLVLENREVHNWRKLAEKLLADPEILAGVHLRFRDTYREVEHAADPSEALDRLLLSLPQKRQAH